MTTPIYLDYAAATPVDAAVWRSMQPYYEEQFYNPSATYLAAQNVRHAIDRARHEVAQVLGARSSEIVFTAGGTEANNLAIHGVMRQFPGAKIVASAIEHESVLEPASQYNHEMLLVSGDGLITIEAIEQAIDDETVLISVMHANNEIGTIQPIHALSQVIDKIRIVRKQNGNTLPLYVHTDACQAANYLDLHVSRLGVDMMTLNGGKIYGPKQSGVLYISANVQLAPQISGGGQERGRRSGTENTPHIIGFSAALAAAQQRRHAQRKALADIQNHFIAMLARHVPSAIVNGSLKHRLPNNVHVTIPGTDNERLIFALDEHGVQAAAGSACSASNDEPSHVLRAIGVSDADAQASLRFTMGRDTTKEMIDYTVQTLAKLVY